MNILIINAKLVTAVASKLWNSYFLVFALVKSYWYKFCFTTYFFLCFVTFIVCVIGWVDACVHAHAFLCLCHDILMCTFGYCVHGDKPRITCNVFFLTRIGIIKIMVQLISIFLSCFCCMSSILKSELLIRLKCCYFLQVEASDEISLHSRSAS